MGKEFNKERQEKVSLAASKLAQVWEGVGVPPSSIKAEEERLKIEIPGHPQRRRVTDELGRLVNTLLENRDRIYPDMNKRGVIFEKNT